MSLEQLEKKLYRPGGGEELEKERQEKSEYDPKFFHESNLGNPHENEWKELPPSFFEKHKKKLFIAGVAIVLIASGSTAVAMYLRSKGIFNKEKVLLSVDGPKTLVSGETIRYSIRYTNNTTVDLHDTELFINPPKDLSGIVLKIHTPTGTSSRNTNGNSSKTQVQTREFSKKMKLGTIEKGTETLIELEGRLIGAQKSIHYLEAALSYTPANISSQFETTSKFSTSIRDVPITFSLEAPQQVYSGEEFSYILDLANNTSNALSDIEIQWELPPGFTLAQSDPELNNNRITKIKTFQAKQVQKITITGTLAGEVNDNKIARITLGQKQNTEFIKYGEDQVPIKIASSYLAITQSVNGSSELIASSGETLNYKIAYKNNTNFSVGGLILRAKLDERFLNIKSLETETGFFDVGTRTITWKGADTPGLLMLAPGKEASVQFSIIIQDPIPIQAAHDKNFSIKGSAEIESGEIQNRLKSSRIFKSNETIVKINSTLALQTKAYYEELTAPDIKNSGPVPPQVGKETTYTIHWRVVNSMNDLESVKITSSLPPNTRWTNKTTTNHTTNILYQEEKNELVWEIGKMPANSPVIEGIFQIALIPSPNQEGVSPDIINLAEISGKDMFTDTILRDGTESIDTSIPDDKKYKGKGDVIQ